MASSSSTSQLLWVGVVSCVVTAMVLIAIWAWFGDSLPGVEASFADGVASKGSDSDTSSKSTVELHASDISVINALPSEFERLAKLYPMLQQANEASLMEMLRQSRDIARPSRREPIQSAIVGRLVAMSPSSALGQLEHFSTHQQDALIETIFSEWSEMDLDSALDAADKLVGFSRSVALESIFRARDDLTSIQLLEIAEELNGEMIANSVISQKQAQMFGHEPKQSWEALLQDIRETDGTKAFSNFELLLRTAEKWYVEDGFSILPEIAASLSSTPSSSAVLPAILKTIVANDPARAFSFVLDLDEGERMLIIHDVAEAWVSADPQSAMQAIQEFEKHSRYKSITTYVLRAWGREDPRGLLDSLDSFSQSSKVKAAEIAISEIANESPDEALQLLDRLENLLPSTDTVRHRIADYWSLEDPHAAMDWILSDEHIEHPQRSSMIQSGLHNLAKVAPDKAMDLALSLSESNSRTEAMVIGSIASYDLETAIRLLPRVREASQALAYTSVVQPLVTQGDHDRALSLAEGVPPSNRFFIYRQLFSAWEGSNPVMLLERLDSFSSDRIKSIAAGRLLWGQRWNPRLSDEQRDYAKSFLNDEQLNEVASWSDL